MNIGGGEAADQMVRMMLSGGEVAVRLSGSAVKNGAAILLALTQNRQKVYGKTRLVKMLRQTRDVRVFPMTAQQYREFRKQAKRLKILYAGVRQTRRKNAPIDVVLPTTELERANQIFGRMLYQMPEKERQFQKESPQMVQQPKKDSRSERDSHDIRNNFSIFKKNEKSMTSEKPSIEGRLKAFQAQQREQVQRVLTKIKTKHRPKVR
jgi:hypothetical protein